MKTPIAWLLGITVALSSMVYGRDLDQDEALRLRQNGQILPLTELLSSAMQRYPGARLLAAQLEEEHELWVYEIELLTQEGTVRELEVNAANGKIIKDELD